MKKYIYYYLLCILASIIGTGYAMDMNHEYKATKLSLPRESSNKYNQAETRLDRAIKGINRKGEPCTYTEEEIDTLKSSLNELMKQYTSTEEFKNYQKQVRQVNSATLTLTPEKVQPDLVELQQGAPRQLYKQFLKLNRQRIKWYDPKSTAIEAGSILVKNPQTKRDESFACDFYSPHYKAANYPDNEEQDTKALHYYNVSENATFHDTLQNLEELKAIMQYKWTQQSWWYRLSYPNVKAYRKQISELQKETDSFKQNRNGIKFVPEQYREQLHDLRSDYEQNWKSKE